MLATAGAPRRGRLGAALLALVLAPLLLLSTGTASAQPAQVGADEVIYELSGRDAPTDYIVVIDSSASMREFVLYNRVRGALRKILPGLPSTDHLSLLTFNSSVELAYTGPMANPVTEINRLPADATNVAYRNIGQVLDEAVKELERPGASPTAAVLLFTNGAANPPPDSKYPVDNEQAWSMLRSRLDALHRPVNAVTFRFGGTASDKDVKRVFGENHKLIGPPPEKIGDYLRDEVDRQRAEIAKEVAREELDHSLAVEWDVDTLDLDSRSAEIALTVRRETTMKIPLVLAGPTVSVTGLPEGRVVGIPDRVEFDADGTAHMTGRLEWGPVGAGVLDPWRSADAKLTLASGLDSPYRDAIQNTLQVPLVPTFQQATIEPDVPSKPNGKFFVLLGVVLLVVALVAWRIWRYQRPSLKGGTLVADVVGARDPHEADLTRRRHAIGAGTGDPNALLAMLPGKGYVQGRRRLRGKDRGKILCYLVYDHNGRSSHTYAQGTHLTRGGVDFGYRR